MAEETDLALQPDEGVTPELEISPEPVEPSQSADEVPTDNDDLFLDAEGYQSTKPNFDHDSPEYKAFRKEKDAKRRKQAIINELQERELKREQELADLKLQVSQVARGNKPTLESCNYDEAAFEQALDQWKSYGSSPKPSTAQASSIPSPTQQQQPQEHSPQINNQLDDHTEYAHFQNEQLLKKKFSDYGDTVEQFKDDLQGSIQRLVGVEVPKEAAVNAIVSVGSTAGVDMARAMYALEKIPQLKSELFQPKVLNNDILVADVLRKAEKAIKSGRRVEAKPPAEIKQGGAVDPLDASVKKAFDAWVASGSQADHRAYQRAKKALKDGRSANQQPVT